MNLSFNFQFFRFQLQQHRVMAATNEKGGAGEEKVWTLEELASTSYVAFQGGVYDMNAFAPGHPGGAELVTEW